MAVWTDLSDGEVAALLDAYAVGSLRELRGIAEGIENTNFLVVTDTGRYILTVYERRVKAADLPFFLGLMEHLAAAGLPCPTPIKARDGQVLRSLRSKPAALISFLDGKAVKKPRARHCAELGRTLAQMHVAGRDYPRTRANDLGPAGWRELWEHCAARADEVQSGLGQAVAAELEAVTAAWPQDLPVGVIHADLFPDNVFFRRDRLTGLIDFYFACTDLFAYDLAICLNAWCFESDGQFNVTKARHLLNAYDGYRRLSAAELRALPLLARGAALRFLLTRLYDWLHHPGGALVQPKDPLEYWHKLAFHRDLASPGAYGLDVPADG